MLAVRSHREATPLSPRDWPLWNHRRAVDAAVRAADRSGATELGRVWVSETSSKSVGYPWAPRTSSVPVSWMG